ncbi:hypothetical protein E1295_38545 [Nonomuraea mesophila]|uniref:Uncharacterized protein n=1 Tax=Nonomuraea mesophila TaxID=2530382 RepID=A0A4R5EFV6_9ACTN|nr:hypothetical protein [Nonomuraea mesophila]TDE33132.1 hypothetical protein E1295_38545 [Nonomuraea mesophila]
MSADGEAVVTVGSLLEELARREAVARQRIAEIREQIAALESRLEGEHDRLSRLVITRETVEEILGEAAGLVGEPVARPGSQVGVSTRSVRCRCGRRCWVW